MTDPVYGLDNSMDNGRYNSYGHDANRMSGGSPVALNGSTGSTALYHHHGSRYGLSMNGRANGADSKMNGLHGPKHKRGDVDRECESINLAALHAKSN